MAMPATRKEYASGLILFDIVDAPAFIGRITINNPSKRNAISTAMWLGLSTLLDDCLVNHPTIRVLILTGQGEVSFSSGADLAEKEGEQTDSTIPHIRLKLHHYPIPLIAQIHGFCLGGGLGLAMSVDIRIASSDAQFSIPAVKLGVACPKDIIDRLTQLVGESHAKLILYTGDRISAERAYSYGLVQHICDSHRSLDEYVLELARTMSRSAPLSMRAIKVMMTNETNQTEMKEAIDRCLASNDMDEGRRAFREKRQANFQGC